MKRKSIKNMEIKKLYKFSVKKKWNNKEILKKNALDILKKMMGISSK